MRFILETLRNDRNARTCILSRVGTVPRTVCGRLGAASLPVMAAFLVMAIALLPVQGMAAADLDTLVALAAKYESGTSAEPLRQIERLLCESVGDSGKRAELEAALIRLLAQETTFEAKRFACVHLAVYGSEASLPALAALLKQEQTVGIACLALGKLRSAKAGDTLRAALSEAKGVTRVQIVDTLGHRAEAASVKALSELAHDADAAVAGAAVRALGAINATSACDAVSALRREANPAVAAAVAEASLNGAEQLAAAGDRGASSAICEGLLKPAFPAHIRRGAFGLLLRCDADGGLQRVSKMLGSAPHDAVLAAVAIAHVPKLRGEGVSKSFGEVLPRLPPSEQVLLVESLACRADADARTSIRAQVVAADPGVRHAALVAVGSLEDASAVTLLAQALAGASTPEETKDVQLALAGLRGGDTTDQAICDVLLQAAAKDKPALMAVLSKRGGNTAVRALLQQSGESAAQVSHAAAQALVRIADGGDSASLAALQAAVAGGDARVREAALRTLAAWRGVAAWDTLAGICLKPVSEAEHALALRGLVRIAGEGNAHPDAVLIGRYSQLLAGAYGDSDRKLILNVLAGAGHPDALALALPLLDVPGVRAVAAQAVERIANVIKATHPDIARDALLRLRNGKATP